MSADLVTNPPIPYSGPIPGGIFPSKTIHVQGFVPHGSQRFSVNLQSGVGTNVSDIALHFNPRFQGGQNVVVCNTKTGQKWGGEERQPHSPFVQGQNFHIIIRCEHNSFKVAVNGNHFLEYRYRILNLQLINAVMIDGTVTVYNIRFEPPSAPAYPAYPPAQPAFPAAQPAYPAAQPAYPAGPKVVSYPPLPYLDTIPGGMRQGKIIVVKVTIKPNPTRFHINFQCGMSNNPRSDIAFHFNPRFNEKAIVMNALRSTRWDGTEQKHRTYFPFHPNGTYEIMFLCEHHEFKVALNGSHLLEFKHRLPFQNISALAVDGDCVVTEINYH
ncbi:galectin-4-like [Acanthaster planci]|uniref:Galectin n=1 Tax=Acanthaster planci TaxID=133434 RepID=A0A8B8A0Z1_ACAPL|nr:galectin-4-like [Acanthaster planci]XP_022111350.1 galectin-4-like [Acanthaster planci]XP_022111351.1 galectin-4-like [Acanthaster planci]